MFKKINKKGFTLAELLIVVAIIGILVAISIPIFTTQLEKSREATDLANLRSAYAAGQVQAMTGDILSGTDPATGKLYYDPSVDGSLTQSGGATIGQGTATDGKVDLSGIPTGIIEYTATTDAKGKAIAVTITDGAVTNVKFE
ncbi:type IV pilin protein [Oribacterium sp. NK2B42]|uniref:type IV pilin protein n=1 Tax=Oribacterium sp. NK2B42 TaxID=689781 RepID=UPI0004006760|nr:prepilin-type N-terminal cleavage/methylation domain-containing protein [Oribacterium sp. NK2B42]